VVFFNDVGADYCVMMTNFPKRAILNPGGLSAFYFIPYYLVAEIPQLYKGEVSSAMVLKPGYTLYQGYASSDSLKFSEKPNKSPNGTFYTQELKGNFPGDSAATQELFTEMELLGNQFF